MIAGGSADHAGHPDIVGIIVRHKVLAPRGVGHWRLQPLGGGDHLVVRPGTAGAGIDRDRVAVVENGCDLVEVGVTRANDRLPGVDGIRPFLVRGRVGDIRRHNQHRDAALRQRRLTGRDRFAPGLLRRQDHLAKDAALLVHLSEIDLLD
jgi:hypothetical protein